MDAQERLDMDALPEISVPEELVWEGDFAEYLYKCVDYPPTIRTAHQRLADSLAHYGREEYTFLRRKVVRYNVFDDPFTPDHRHAIYGRNVDLSLMRIMRVFQAAAHGLGQERRMYLLRGPVGTAKSTFAELIALTLEDYTRKPEGQLFSPYWIVEPDDEEGIEILGTSTRRFERNRRDCPLHEEPLRVLPLDIREQVRSYIAGRAAEKVPNLFSVEGNPCTLCNSIFRKFMRRYNHNWKTVVEKHLRTQRYVLSKTLRQGIVITRPKSEKDQDVTEFLGSTDYANLGAFGSPTDPRTFDWAGHYMAANRGGLLFEEQLKFALQFLYDCLGASQEHRVQPRGFTEVDVDLFILGTTNEPEYKRLLQDDKMEALRDRMIVVDIPYILRLSDEVKIYRKFFTPERTGGKHMAPRTIYYASYYGLATRLEEPKKANLTLRDKIKLYDGRQVVGFSEDSIPELQKEAEREGLEPAISPRYINDKISAACMAEEGEKCVNFFSVLRELRDGLKHHQHITSEDQRKRYENLHAAAMAEMEEHIAGDIQEAASGSEDEMVELFERYISHTAAFINKERIRNPITDEDEQPETSWLESIENKIGITDHADFRQKVLNQMQRHSFQRERDKTKSPFDYRTDERLYSALRLFLFDQVKERINWERLIARKTIVDTRARAGEESEATESERVIDRVRQNLMTQKFGPERETYCEVCAQEVLVYFASALVRTRKKEG
ncbi:MAG: serine protein kinase [bacterium]|nr:serine protein kinase [bacterium]MDZ4285163.1 serine protein kinase [Patescibacteria group bacterium]